MTTSIEHISITALHGNRNIAASLKENTLILVGENGSGKTTFLRILFDFLSGRWFSLLQFKFDTISARISGTEYQVTHESLSKAFERTDRRYLSEMPHVLRHKLMDLVSMREVQDIPGELERWARRHAIPLEVIMRELELFEDNPRGARKSLQDSIQKIRRAVDAQILYLPTYRRIERELSSIFEGIDPDDLRRGKSRSRLPDTEEAYVELVEFGMKDVQQAIDRSLESLKDFARESLTSLTLRYLGDVVDREYLDVGMKEIAQMPEDTIRSVLERLHESILTKDHKEHLLTVLNAARTSEAPDEHSKIICHYFLKLLHFQETLKLREQQISAFCELCSKYIQDKKFVYDSVNFGFSILFVDPEESDRRVQLSDLSSGEKQIVSLFSHLYLSGKAHFFVLIDEPELSLSVPWQRRFLPDIRNGEFCSGLVAVTHSPFIYDNDLRQYAHALGEFVGL